MNLTTTYAGRMLAALAISVGLIQCGASDAPDGETPTPEETGAYTRVSVRDMEWVPFSHSFAVQGNVETDRVANVLAEFPGVVEEVLRKEGDQVAKGDALVRINTDVLGKQREELLTQLALAQTLLERQERLWGKDIGSEVDFLQAQAGVQSLERSLATLDEQLDKAVIRAPFSGVLDRIFSNVGEMAAPPMPVVRVVDLNDLYVRASVSDHYAGALSEGQEVRVEVRGMEEGLGKPNPPCRAIHHCGQPQHRFDGGLAQRHTNASQHGGHRAHHRFGARQRTDPPRLFGATRRQWTGLRVCGPG